MRPSWYAENFGQLSIQILRVKLSVMLFVVNVLCTNIHGVAYAVSKYGVTLAVVGMSHEFKSDGIAVNALWPRTGKSACVLYV